jgi:hypothetical protein
MLQVAEDLAAAIELPGDCRIDIQWNHDALVISRNGKYGFAILRQSIDDNTHITAAKAGMILLMSDHLDGLQEKVNVIANVDRTVTTNLS